MRQLGVMIAGVALVTGGPGVAAELVAIKPGTMCVSTDALARLTLPDGDSRTHVARPRPEDIVTAMAGGCIDIPPGARVQVQQAFRNTSRVTYAGPGAPPDGIMTVPNIDFRPATDAATPVTAGVVPAGLAVSQRLAAGGGMTLVLLQDFRITPALREAMESVGGDPEMAFSDHGKPYAEFATRPVRNGQLVLQSVDGTVIGRTILDRPFASITPAPLHGMPVPTFVFMVNYSVGMGGFNGPVSVLLAPVTQGLVPLQAAPTRGGRSEPISLASTLHAAWRIVPARGGGPEEIEAATCAPSAESAGPLELRTYRFHDGRWTFAARNAGRCNDVEVFPDRRLFP